MKTIAIKYLKWGWLITLPIMAYLGYLSAKRHNQSILYGAIAGHTIICCIMLWAKYK
jgi:hypothetical protein